MKILVVFYSRTGNTKKIGEEISKNLKSDIDEIIDQKSRNGAIGFLTGGIDAMKKLGLQIGLKKCVRP